MRQIENSDLWSAIRGLGMFKLPEVELSQLILDHQDNPLFASKVIAEAARQAIALRNANPYAR